MKKADASQFVSTVSSHLLKTANPYASPALSREEDEEEEKRKKFPWLPLAGAGALGYGAYKLPNVFGGSPQQVDTFERATKDYNPQAFAGSFNTATNEYINKGLPKNMTELQYYQSVLAPAAQLDIGGKPVGDALVAIRGNKKLMKFLEDQKVISPGYGLNDRASMFGNSGAGHYRQFRQGSIPAYMHMMTAHHKGKKVPYSMLSDDELKQAWSVPGVEEVLQNALAYSAGPESSTDSIPTGFLNADSPLSYPEWIERRLQKHLASKVPSSGTPWELDTRFLPEEEQQELMKSWFASMTPEEQKYRLQIEDLPEKYITQTSNYLPKAQTVTGIRKRLQQAAPYIAGGAGLYGLYKLINYLRDNEDEKEEEEREEEEQSLAKAAAEKQAQHGIKGLAKSTAEMFSKPVKSLAKGVEAEIGGRPTVPNLVQFAGTTNRNVKGKPSLPLDSKNVPKGEYLGNIARAAILPRIPKALGGRKLPLAATALGVGYQAGPAMQRGFDVYQNPQNYIKGGDELFAPSLAADNPHQVAPSEAQVKRLRDIGEEFVTNYSGDLFTANLSGINPFNNKDNSPYFPYQSRVDAAIGNTMSDFLANQAMTRASDTAQEAAPITPATPLKGIGPSFLTAAAVRELGRQSKPVAMTIQDAITNNLPEAYGGVENPIEILEDLQRSALLQRLNQARRQVPAGVKLDSDRLIDFLNTKRESATDSGRTALDAFIAKYLQGED